MQPSSIDFSGIGEKITTNGVYAGFGSNTDFNYNSPTNEKLSVFLKGSANQGSWGALSGENYINKKVDKNHWFSLDLCEKYNKNSMLKQYHMVTIYLQNSQGNKPPMLIKATLPEQFSYSIGGVWKNPVSIGSDLFTSIIQQISGGKKSGELMINSYLQWQKPKPFEFVLKIPVFDDSGTGTNINYQEAIAALSEAILPRLSSIGVYESIPGPIMTRVLKNQNANGEKAQKGAKTASSINDFVQENVFCSAVPTWDHISIQLGGFLLVDWCVLKDLKVTFPNTKNMVIHNYTDAHPGYNYKVHLQPLQAEIELTVSTVVSLTVNKFHNMVYLTEQKEADLENNVENTAPALAEQAEIARIREEIRIANAARKASPRGTFGDSFEGQAGNWVVRNDDGEAVWCNGRFNYGYEYMEKLVGDTGSF